MDQICSTGPLHALEITKTERITEALARGSIRVAKPAGGDAIAFFKHGERFPNVPTSLENRLSGPHDGTILKRNVPVLPGSITFDFKRRVERRVN